MTEALTIHLPENLYRQLQRFAELAQQSPETIVTSPRSRCADLSQGIRRRFAEATRI